MTKFNKFWALAIILLIAIITISSLTVWSTHIGNQPVEICVASGQELPSEIYIGGAVSNPGFYPSKAGDSIEDIIQAGGGITSSTNLSSLRIYIPYVEEPVSSSSHFLPSYLLNQNGTSYRHQLVIVNALLSFSQIYPVL